MMDEEQETPEPDFLDILDMWDEPLDYDDEDGDEPFVPLLSRGWIRIFALLIAVSMIALTLYQGIQLIIHR